MKVAWFDGSAGASGDMMLGALVDSGVPVSVLQAGIDPLGLGVELSAKPVQRAALGATKVDVKVSEPRTVRHLPEIAAMFEVLDDTIASAAIAVFERLAIAEAAVHQMPVDHVRDRGVLDREDETRRTPGLQDRREKHGPIDLTHDAARTMAHQHHRNQHRWSHKHPEPECDGEAGHLGGAGDQRIRADDEHPSCGKADTQCAR